MFMLAKGTWQSQSRIWIFSVSHSLIWWIVLGLLAGWLTGKITRGRGFGCLANVFLGLIGAVIGGWLFTKLGIGHFTFLGSLAAAVVGAVILVAIARLFAGGKE